VTRNSLIFSAGALAVLVLLVPLTATVWLSALATVSLVAAFWDRAPSAFDGFMRACLSSTAAGLALWLAINSNWRAEPTGFAIAAAVLVAVRLWSIRSGKITGPPALASPS